MSVSRGGFGGVEFDGEPDGAASSGELSSDVFDGGLRKDVFLGEGGTFMSTYCSLRRLAQRSSNVFNTRSTIWAFVSDVRRVILNSARS